ncbi:MAG TPA: methyltransferase domain-containing protein [Dehalococcoidales bacterium]|nr:methyltransferase domain-containing protein [Dehalococcoidales bacterium]
MQEGVSTIDYQRLWSEQMKDFDHAADIADYWDRRSQVFHCSCHESDYAEQLIKRMKLKEGSTILDVGCGCGAVALPLARKGFQVTALDISPVRLEKLRVKAEAEVLPNIQALNLDWDLVEAGVNVRQHDVVLLSRNIHQRMAETLQKVAMAARSAFYITWRAERTDDLEMELADAMGKNFSVFPDYAIINGMIRQQGVLTEVEAFEATETQLYRCLEDAVLNFARGASLTENQFARMERVAGNYLTRVDDGFSLDRKIKWVLISWKAPAGKSV